MVKRAKGSPGREPAGGGRRIVPGQSRKLLLLIFYGGLFALLPAKLPGSEVRLRVSPVYRSALSLKYRGQSWSSGKDLPDLKTGIAREGPHDDLNYGDRIFADGFVGRDDGTGKSEGLLPDSTWNWGYDSASQYDPVNHSLTFRKPVEVRQEQLERLSGEPPAERKSDRTDAFCGLEFALEVPLGMLFSGEILLSAGWQWIPLLENRAGFTSYRQNYRITRSLLAAEEVYTYRVYGDEIPPPGHAGCVAGPFADPPSPGSLIANRPATIDRIFTGPEQVLQSELLSLHNRVHCRLSCEQQEFWGGPVFRWRLRPWLYCSISPRVNLLFASAELCREEQLWQTSSENGTILREKWHNRTDRQRLLPGASLNCSLECDFENGFFTGLTLTGAWYPEELELRAGPGQVELKTGTVSAGTVFGYRF